MSTPSDFAVTIYGIRRIGDADIVYVGQTRNLAIRKTSGYGKELSAWLDAAPWEYVTLEVAPRSLATLAEQRHIDGARARGCRLFNKRDATPDNGGDSLRIHKFTMLLEPHVRAALEKRAKADGRSAANFLRRFILGLTSLALIACGGETFSSPGPVGSAGMPSGSAGMAADAGSGGSGGMPGAAGMGGGYDGPAWVECADGVLTARGIEAMMSEVEITVSGEYLGPDSGPFVSCTLAGKKSEVGSASLWTKQVSGSFVTVSSHFDEAIVPVTTPTGVYEIEDETVVPDNFLSCSFTWSSEVGSEPVELQRCLVRVSGSEVAAWSPAP